MISKEKISEAIALLKGPFGVQIHKSTAAYVAPIFWISKEGKKISVLGHGSIFFLRPENISFAVTANHVYKAYLDAKKSDPKTICQIDNIPFDPEDRLIDSSTELDIATFRISSDEIKKINKRELTKWPPIIPEIGKGVLFAGFPRKERLTLSQNEFSFGIYSALGTATTVNDKNITCQFEREHWIEISGLELPPEGYSIAGLSGAPLLTVLEQKGLWLWTLGGVIYEFNTNLEIVFASRADKILSNGKLIN